MNRNLSMAIFIVFSLACLVAAPFVSAQEDVSVANTDRSLPPVNALVPNFYYEDLDAARTFYIDKLGFPIVADIGWVVIVEIAPGRQLALVDGDKGTLSPVSDKGVLLVIETDALEQWYDYITAIDGIDWYQYGLDFRDGVRLRHGIMDHETIQEFRIVDPEGYIIEFFRWKENAKP